MTASLLVVVAALVVWQQALVRVAEAWLAAGISNSLGVVPADSLRTAVVFPLEGRFVGYSLAPGCTVALIVAPFLLIGAGLIGSGRIAVRRGLATVATVSAVLVLVNQARLLVVTGSIRLWGFENGYARSHILLGTVVSTVGVVGGVLLFLAIATRQPSTVGRRSDG